MAPLAPACATGWRFGMPNGAQKKGGSKSGDRLEPRGVGAVGAKLERAVAPEEQPPIEDGE